MLEGDDFILWETLSPFAMSDEEKEEGTGVKKLHTLPWRTEEATDLIRRIDATLGETRTYGEPSERKPCINCEAFVKPDYEPTEEN